MKMLREEFKGGVEIIALGTNAAAKEPFPHLIEQIITKIKETGDV